MKLAVGECLLYVSLCVAVHLSQVGFPCAVKVRKENFKQGLMFKWSDTSVTGLIHQVREPFFVVCVRLPRSSSVCLISLRLPKTRA